LGHVILTCVFEDIAEGYPDDSLRTIHAKTELYRMINHSLQGFGPQSDDFIFLSILYLMSSEIGRHGGGHFNLHYQALERLIPQRGASSSLGHENIAALLKV